MLPAHCRPAIASGAPQQTSLIQKAHQDDIHGLIRISPTRFVSGSKDGSIRIWSTQGIAESNPPQGKIDYTKWITALAPCSRPDFFLSGTRAGSIALRDHQSHILSELELSSGQFVKGCKERNQARVNCITAWEEKEAFVGTLGCFIHYDLENKHPLSQCDTSPRDWVYCIHPFSRERVLAVTGTELEVWGYQRNTWQRQAIIQSQQEQRRRGSPRPFISAITPLLSDPALFGIAVFDGSIRVRDINTSHEVIRYTEHQGRTWAVANMTRAVIASCADDATVKFWDLRQAHSVCTLSAFPGRVSCLLPLEDHQLITASCPDQPWTSKTKAELAFWDLRCFASGKSTAPMPPNPIGEIP